jgi:dihydroneopterin aldolase/D-erythro-7,8-dihydroneopterin triphosphate epimerase
MVRGIVGVNPDERTQRQDIVVNVTMWADLRPPGLSDDLNDAINYSTVAKALIQHLEQAQPYLVERLAADLVRLCFEADGRVQAVELTVEKPGAVRFAKSVGVTLYRQRHEVLSEGE